MCSVWVVSPVQNHVTVAKNSKKGSSFSKEIAVSCSQGSYLYHFKKLYLNLKRTIQSGTALKINKTLSSTTCDVVQDK